MRVNAGVKQKAGNLAWQAVLPLGVVTLWWVWSAQAHSLYFPPLSRVMVAFKNTWFGVRFVHNAVPSLFNLAIGYVVGTGLGIGLGVVIGLVKAIEWLLSPLIEFGRALPPPAILPFAILLLGIGTNMKVGIISFGIFFVILLNTVDGVRAVEPTLRDVGRVYRLAPARRIVAIVLPAASPQIIAGMRTAVSLGLLMMIVSEMVASTSGIGFFTLQAQQNFDFPHMWAGMILLAVLGYVLNLAFDFFERRILFWHQGITKGTTQP